MGWLMSTLKPLPDGNCSATIHFGSYTIMMGFVADLMRVCAIVETGDTYVAGPLDYERISVAGLMDVALQLLPTNECEFLDEARVLLTETPASTEDPADDSAYFLSPSHNNI